MDIICDPVFYTHRYVSTVDYLIILKYNIYANVNLIGKVIVGLHSPKELPRHGI